MTEDWGQHPPPMPGNLRQSPRRARQLRGCDTGVSFLGTVHNLSSGSFRIGTCPGWPGYQLPLHPGAEAGPDDLQGPTLTGHCSLPPAPLPVLLLGGVTDPPCSVTWRLWLPGQASDPSFPLTRPGNRSTWPCLRGLKPSLCPSLCEPSGLPAAPPETITARCFHICLLAPQEGESHPVQPRRGPHMGAEEGVKVSPSENSSSSSDVRVMPGKRQKVLKDHEIIA